MIAVTGEQRAGRYGDILCVVAEHDRRDEMPSRCTKSSRSAPTWRVDCQMVRSEQHTGLLIPVV
jgi:hypothetical protein